MTEEVNSVESARLVLAPLDRAWSRVEIDLQDSEAAAFHSLLYLGELVVKLAAVAFASGIQADTDRRQYAIEHRLIRGSGVGEHASALDEILIGPTYEILHPELQALQKQLVAKCSAGTLEAECLTEMAKAMASLGIQPSTQAPSNTLRAWFHWFVQVRNKTRGHGAVQSEKLTAAYPSMRRAMQLLTNQLEVFAKPWAFVRLNLSGKYRVVSIGGDGSVGPLMDLRSGLRRVDRDGIYMVCGDLLAPIRLCVTDADLSDFYVPNGSFQNGRCEFISLITGNALDFDASDYLAPTTSLPVSETQGRRELDVVGSCFSNMPGRPENYVRRSSLEDDLRDVLLLGRHEIASLAGPGGVGKTSLALEVCHSIARSESVRFSQIIWFSARDIDLLPSGPKPVRPDGLTLKDFSKAYVELTNPGGRATKGFKADEYFASEMASPEVGPILFVFDNFETVSGQAELFAWIDAHVRSPNKVLITTRTREFSGDKSLSVRGMEDAEARQLIDTTAQRLGVAHLLNIDRTAELLRESSGHPYVLKILIGEIASRGAYAAPQRLIADEERLLAALFERTYSRLTPAAQLIFLLLSSWKSAIPSFAVEATLLYHVQERLRVPEVLDELVRLSMVEEISSQGGIVYLNVPLVAATFGKKKLLTSSERALVEKCLETLRLFGATQESGANRTALEVSQRFVNSIQRKIEAKQVALEDVRPLLEGIASATPSVWGVLENLVSQLTPGDLDLRIAYLKRFIESSPPKDEVVSAWRSLALLLSTKGDSEGEVLAYGEIARLPGSSVRDVSEAANRLNNALRSRPQEVGRLSFDSKRATIDRIAKRLKESYLALNATDLSRLAWLYLNSGDEQEARRIANDGIEREPLNDYCLRLLDRLSPDREER